VAQNSPDGQEDGASFRERRSADRKRCHLRGREILPKILLKFSRFLIILRYDADSEARIGSGGTVC
jgi:hypothetical protein